MNAQTSRVITTLRYPLALLVVACHAQFLVPPVGEASELWYSWEWLLRMQLFVCEVVPHVAVPLFMLFSGMLLFRHGALTSAHYFSQLKRRVHTLLIPYLIWNSFCFMVAVYNEQTSFSFLHWLQGLWDTQLWVNGGTFSLSLPGYPMCMPLWFMRDLIILVLLSYPLGWLLKKTHGWLLLAPALWWFPGHEKVFGFGADSLFFFSVGAWISLKNLNLLEVKRLRIPSYLFAAVMLVADTVICFRIFGETHQMGFEWIPFNLFVVSMMAATLNIAQGLAQKPVGRLCAALADSSFFLYASHIVFLPWLQKELYVWLMPGSQAAHIAFFWAFLAGYILLLTATFYLLQKYLPGVTAILTGGRTRNHSHEID